MDPYSGVPKKLWEATTKELIRKHPLKKKDIVEVALGAWDAIFESTIGPHRFKIGRDLFPSAQIMGYFLHELIPLELAARYPNRWRREQTSREKDLVYLPNPAMSVEIKTSSHKTRIFGNRSYAQKPTSSKKSKSGFYLAINFEKFGANPSIPPEIIRIRFGWLDHTDWIGQTADTGQQAHLAPCSEQQKLVTLFSKT